MRIDQILPLKIFQDKVSRVTSRTGIFRIVVYIQTIRRAFIMEFRQLGGSGFNGLSIPIGTSGVSRSEIRRQCKRRLQPLPRWRAPGTQRLEPSLTAGKGKGWSLRLRWEKAKAGAFAYGGKRQRLEPSLTAGKGKGWSLRLQRSAAR